MPIESMTGRQVEIMDWTSPGNDRALVMLHASATGPAALSRLAASLLGGGCDVSAPALPGYGATHLLSDESPVAQARAVASGCLRRRAAQKSRLLFGHSMGGLIALLCALDEQEQGRPLDGLVLFDPVLVGLLDTSRASHRHALEWDREIIASLGDCVAKGAAELGVAQFVEAWNEAAWGDLPAKIQTELVATAPRLVLETRAVSFQQLDPAAISRLETPVLVLNGSASPALIHLTSEVLAGLLPNGRLEMVDGVGHMAPVLAPGKVAPRVQSFIHRHG